MKIITNTFIFETSNNKTKNFIADLKERGIPLENFIDQNNQLCLNTTNIPLFATLKNTTSYNVITKLKYSLYYQKELLATTEKKIDPFGEETYSTRINKTQLPSVLSFAPAPLMKPEDYDYLLQSNENAFWKGQPQKIMQIEFEQSLLSAANIAAFNEHAAAVFQSCYSALTGKTNQTSFDSFFNQFNRSEKSLIKQSQFLLEYFSYFTPENKNMAKAIGLEFLRTITDGYSFIPSHPFDAFFTESSERKAYIDNFISFTRLAYDKHTRSSDGYESEEGRFHSLMDFAILNNLDKEMDNEQKNIFWKQFIQSINIIACPKKH